MTVPLPCPFCGELPRVIDNDGYGKCQVFCICPAEPCIMLSSDSMVEAVALWNQRAPETQA